MQERFSYAGKIPKPRISSHMLEMFPNAGLLGGNILLNH